MTLVTDSLRKLNEISCNPNLNGGVWNSFSLFLSTSDEILKNTDDIERLPISEELKNKIINDVENIRYKFEKEFGIQLGEKTPGQKFERAKNSKVNAHKFRSKVSSFLQQYKGHFTLEE